MQQGTQAAGGEKLSYRAVGHAIDSSAMTRALFWVIVLTSLASLFDAGDAYVIGFAMPGIGKEFGLKPEALGAVAAASMLGMTIGSYIWGWVADKAGRKIAFTATLLFFSLFSGVCGLATTFGVLVGARFLAGTGIGGAVPVDGSILAEFAPARIRGYCAGMQCLTWPLATFLVSAIAFFVLPHWGWRGMFYVFVVPALLAFWVRRGMPESPRWLANRGRFAEARKGLHYLGISDAAIERSQVAVQNEPPLPQLPTAVIRDLFAPQVRRTTAYTWMLWGLPQMASWGIIIWLPKLFMRLYGTTLKQAVAYMLYISLASVVSRSIGYLLLDKAGRKPFMIIGFTGSGLAIGAIPIFAHTAFQFFLLAFVLRAFSELAYTSSTVYTPEVFPLHIRVLGSSSAMGFGRLGGALGTFLTGVLVTGHITAMWSIFSASCLIPGLLTIWLGIETKGRNLEELTKSGIQAAAEMHQVGAAAGLVN